jgi:hypothetical protein
MENVKNTNENITKCIKILVHLNGLYTHAKLIELTGISRKTWFDRMKYNNWKKTEVLALKQLNIID